MTVIPWRRESRHRRTDRRTSGRLARQLPDVAAEMARLVDSGSTLTDAFDVTSREFPPPVGPELRTLSEALRYGRSTDGALREWAERASCSGVTLLVAACRLGLAEGGNLVVALEGVAAALGDSLETADEAVSLTTQARASAFVLMSLPVVGAVLFAVLDPAVTSLLLGTRTGWILLALGVLLDAIGALVMVSMLRWSLR